MSEHTADAAVDATSDRISDVAPARVFDVMHDTSYRYASDVALAHHIAYLRPAETAHQQLESFRIGVRPTPYVERLTVDAFGNRRLYFSIDVPHPRLAVRAVSRVVVRPRFDGFVPSATGAWDRAAAHLRYCATAPYAPQSEFAYPSPYVPRHLEITRYAAASFPAGRPVAAGALDLMRRIHHDFRYAADATEVSTPVLEAFEARRGVCQDFAHIMIGGLRGLGLAARYVSGYLLTQPPPGRPRLVGADASHAWVSVWCPQEDGASTWLDLDPTNDVVPSTSHVTLAIGRDFGDVSPLRGIIRGGGEHELRVGVTVRPVGET